MDMKKYQTFIWILVFLSVLFVFCTGQSGKDKNAELRIIKMYNSDHVDDI